MVQSRAPDIAAYVRELPADRRPAVERMVALARQHLVGFQERMEYGMPYFSAGDGKAVGIASQVQYLALYVDPAVVAAHRPKMRGLKVGKSCVRFPDAERVDWALVEALLRDAARAPAGR